MEIKWTEKIVYCICTCPIEGDENFEEGKLYTASYYPSTSKNKIFVQNHYFKEKFVVCFYLEDDPPYFNEYNTLPPYKNFASAN